MIKNTSFLLIALFLITACGQRSSDQLETSAPDQVSGELQVPPETMNEIILNIASPIETAALIRSMDIPFSTIYLANPENLPTNATNVEVAYYLGALSADLGYLNMYEMTGTAVDYLYSIFQLAGALQIEQFFDFDKIQELATSGTNLDSLMFLSISSFNNMDQYLRETDRNHLSALMVAGVWMEGLYLTTQVALQNDSEEIRAMIGDQKLIVNDLLLVLNNYRNNEIIEGYILDFETIKSAFDDVKITYEVGEPETEEVDGMLVVVQRESSFVEISDQTLQKIIYVTEQVRNMHLNIN